MEFYVKTLLIFDLTFFAIIDTFEDETFNSSAIKPLELFLDFNVKYCNYSSVKLQLSIKYCNSDLKNL